MNMIKISKTTLLAAAIIGAPAAFAGSTINSSETNTTYENSQSSTQVERDAIPGNDTGMRDSTTNIPSQSQDDTYTSSTESATEQQQNSMVREGGDAQAGPHVQLLEFEADSVMLSDAAQDQLDTLAGSLDKDTPAKVTVQAERQPDPMGASEGLATNDSAGQATGSETTRGQAGAAQLSQEMQENERLLSEHRAERVKQFLEDRGIEVSEVNVEGNDPQNQGLSATETSEEEDMGSAQATAEDVQEVLIVISERQAQKGISVR